MSSCRHCTSTWISTSSGIMFSSMIRRWKSKSVCDAEGKPTSISLNPTSTSVWNSASFRSESIGSISAWFPSRRSTLAQRGARVNWRSGQVRSCRTSGTCERYLSKGIGDGSQGRAR